MQVRRCALAGLRRWTWPHPAVIVETNYRRDMNVDQCVGIFEDFAFLENCVVRIRSKELFKGKDTGDHHHTGTSVAI